MRRWISEALRIEKGQRILDIGCGPGRLYDFLPETSYVGIDLSISYLTRARKLFPNGRFRQSIWKETARLSLTETST